MTTYDGHRIPQQCNRMTPEQQRALLDWHTLFSGRCPECELPIAFVGQDKCLKLLKGEISWNPFMGLSLRHLTGKVMLSVVSSTHS